MSRQFMLQVASLVLTAVMLVLIFVSWHVLGVALERRRWLYRLYQAFTVGVVALLFAALALLFWYDGWDMLSRIQ